MESRLHKFQQDKESLSKYRQGIQLLREARVDLVLLELSSAEPVNIAHPQGIQMAAAKHHEALGYQKCLADLLDLDSVQVATGEAPLADYGATERMLKSGEITEEQARELRGE